MYSMELHGVPSETSLKYIDTINKMKEKEQRERKGENETGINISTQLQPSPPSQPYPSIYRGSFKKGLRHGQGVFTWSNGQIQNGSFNDGNFIKNEKEE
jgi:hypothetical protein